MTEEGDGSGRFLSNCFTLSLVHTLLDGERETGGGGEDEKRWTEVKSHRRQ